MIQKINLKKGQIMKKSEIIRVLDSSRGSFSYTLFTLGNGIYFKVNFNRDLTISIQTNTRDLRIYNEIQNITRVYTPMRLYDFIFRWIRDLNK